MSSKLAAHEETQVAWETNAAVWDEAMGEVGNSFVNTLIWPATRRLLDLQPGERVLDAACGNGLYSRWLAELGGQVTAFDFAQSMIERARQYPPVNFDVGQIDYHVLDGTDEAALLTLGERSFDAAICQMALMDMSEIAPLLRALAKLLKPEGRFIFATTHPVFNSAHCVRGSEAQEVENQTVTTHYMKILRYLTPSSVRGFALRDQPALQFYFERSLQDLLAPCFAAGFVLDALEERAFPPEDVDERRPLAKSGHFSEFPQVLVCRLRLG